MKTKTESSYLKRVVKTSDDLCWSWNGAKHSAGYGVFGAWSSVVYAHRVSYEIHKGPIPGGMDVIHLCHNPECSNPHHLDVGSRKENMQTSFTAGRLQRKIPISELPKIYQDRKSGITLQAIGDRYGCTKQAIRHMLNRHPELCNA